MHILSRFLSIRIPGPLFRDLSRQFTYCLLILAVYRSLARFASVKPYLENVKQPPLWIFDMTNRNEFSLFFFFFKSPPEKKELLSFPVRTAGRTSSRSHGDVWTKLSRLDGFTKFSWVSACRALLLIIIFTHTKQGYLNTFSARARAQKGLAEKKQTT